jgi:hypothetical protein
MISDCDNVVEGSRLNATAKEFNKDFNDINTIFTNDNRLSIKINGQLVDLSEDPTEVSIIKPADDKIYIEYYFQGINGEWVDHNHTIEITNYDDNIESQKVDLKIVNTKETN